MDNGEDFGRRQDAVVSGIALDPLPRKIYCLPREFNRAARSSPGSRRSKRRCRRVLLRVRQIESTNPRLETVVGFLFTPLRSAANGEKHEHEN
jgi:hypothetical protein